MNTLSEGVVQADLPWLKEVHSKIWNREDLRPQLFRKVKVTQEDYFALKTQLKELHPDRDSPDYDGTKLDVLSVKLNFLRSLTPAEDLSSPHPDDKDVRVGDDDALDASKKGDDDVPDASNQDENDGPDARVGDDDDPDANKEDDEDADDAEEDLEGYCEATYLFPSILSFLDFSTLELKESVSNRLPLPLLLRQEDKDLTELIKKKPKNSGGSVIITGQPGTGEFLVSHLTGSNQPYHYQGKTAYIYLRIIENMIEGRPFLFQAIGGTVYHVAEKGVEAVQSWSSEETIEAFVDGDKKEPSYILRRPSVQLIVASPPSGASPEWAKQIGPGSFVTQLVVKPWSENELELTGQVLALLSTTSLIPLCRIFLHPSDLPYELLSESDGYFGNIPRRRFEASSSTDKFEAIKSELESAIRGAPDTWPGPDGMMKLLHKARSGGPNSDLAYMVYEIFPSNTDTKQLFSGCHIGPVSKWSMDLILDEYNKKEKFKRPLLRTAFGGASGSFW